MLAVLFVATTESDSYYRPTMDDPHIQAFTVIDDRLSKLEEDISSLIDRKKRKELRHTGYLDHIFLGYKFRIHRYPYEFHKLNPSNYQATKEEYFLNDTIYDSVFSFESLHLGWHEDKECATSDLFTENEFQQVKALYGTEDVCIRNREAKIESSFSFVCDEACNRRLQKVVREMGIPVQVHLLDTEIYSFYLYSAEPVLVTTLLDYAVDIVKLYVKLYERKSPVIEEVSIYPMSYREIRDYESVSKIQWGYTAEPITVERKKKLAKELIHSSFFNLLIEYKGLMKTWLE